MLALALVCFCSAAWGAGSAPTTKSNAPPKFADFMRQLGYSRIGLKVDYLPQLTVRGHLNGKSTRFLVDTGCAMTTIHTSKAKNLPRLDGRTFLLDDSFLGELKGETLVAMNRLEIGGVQFLNQPASVLDLDMTDRPDVILGNDLLRRNHAVLYTRETSLFVREKPLSEKATQVFETSLGLSGFEPLALKNGVAALFVVPVLIHDEPANLLLDTGVNLTLIDVKHAQQLGLQLALLNARAQGLQGRSSPLAETQLRTIRIGAWSATNYSVGVANLRPWLPPRSWRLLSGLELHGFLGVDLLVHCSGLVDFQRARLFVQRGSSRP